MNTPSLLRIIERYPCLLQPIADSRKWNSGSLAIPWHSLRTIGKRELPKVTAAVVETWDRIGSNSW